MAQGNLARWGAELTLAALSTAFPTKYDLHDVATALGRDRAGLGRVTTALAGQPTCRPQSSLISLVSYSIFTT